MELSIGIQNIARELTLDTEQSVEEISALVSEALENKSTLSLTDSKGRTVIVPSSTLAFVSMGPDEPRRVGFGVV